MMPRVLRHDDPALPGALQEALETGQTIIFPTDTVYGIGGNPWDKRTLVRVRTLKERPEDQPFALLVANTATIERYAVLDDRLRQLVERLLPGAYTLLLPSRPSVPSATSAAGKVGVRVPEHPFFRETLAALDRPLFGTSVNRHGEPPLVDEADIIDRFAAVDLIVTGPTSTRPSAILDLTCTPPQALRGDLPAFLSED